MSSFPTFDSSRLTKKTAAAQYSSDSDQEDGYFGDPSGADDHFGDFNPRKRRRVGDTKERAALGVFGSDSEDDALGRHWKKKTLRGKGMAFVSKGEPSSGLNDREYSDESDVPGHEPNHGDVDDHADEDEDEEEEEDGEEATPGMGLGFRAANGGLGFSAARRSEDRDEEMMQDEPPRPSFPKSKFDGSNPLGRGFVPSSAKQPVLQEPEEEKTSSTPNIARPSAFSGSKGSQSKLNPKSFGARMMAKMGYVEGTGLGREGQGRNVIIEANLRPQGIGLGAVKEKSEAERTEEKRQAKLRGEKIVDSDEEEQKRKREWKKKMPGGFASSSTTSTPRRQKTSFLTAEELQKTAPGLHIPDAFAPILDMTGPDNRILTSTSGLLTPTSGAVSESTETAEARRLVRRAHAELAAFSEEWKSLEERKAFADLEIREREQESTALASDLSRLQLFTQAITDELPSAAEWPDVIRCLVKAVDYIGTSNANEDVVDIAVAIIHPFFRDPDWHLLEQPDRFTAELKELSHLILKSESTNSLDKWDSTRGLNSTDLYRHHQRATTPYETMMYKLWYPKAMNAIRDWKVHEPSSLLAVLEAWNDILPPFVRAQFLDSAVRKLESAVADWNPRKRKQTHTLPHLWLFPWLQHLPSHHLEPKGTGLLAEVRRKFCQLIDVWNFERGIVPGLEQWRDLLGSGWQSLLISHVLPSMGRYLRENFRVDPSDQEPYLLVLTGVLEWTDILGPKVLGQVLVSEVFPLWHEKLSEWLGLEEMNLEEVYAWYEWWRDQVFPAKIAGLSAVRREFEKGSITIEKALENM